MKLGGTFFQIHTDIAGKKLAASQISSVEAQFHRSNIQQEPSGQMHLD